MPLHYAVQKSSVECVQRLVDLKASLEGRLREGQCAGFTPTDLARDMCSHPPQGYAGPAAAVLRILDPTAFQPVPQAAPAQKEPKDAGGAQPWWAKAVGSGSKARCQQPEAPPAPCARGPCAGRAGP